MNPEPQIQIQSPKKSKMVKTDNVRIRRDTKKKILTELAALNKKDIGRKVTVDDYIHLAISRLKPEDLSQLKEKSLSNKDRLELKYQEYCSDHGKVSKDEFLGVLLTQGLHGNG